VDLLHDPRILILDEAPSAIDTASEREVEKALDALMGRGPPLPSPVDNRQRRPHQRHRSWRRRRNRTHRSLLRQDGVYASLYQEQIDGKVQWQGTGGDIMTDGTIRHRQPPARVAQEAAPTLRRPG
jgi:ATP-binding cassette subfamily B protein